MKKKTCKHEYEMQSTIYEFPIGTTGTSMAIEYAYIMCIKCGEVIKKKVKYD